jgi:excisionase family DNA binding protein
MAKHEDVLDDVLTVSEAARTLELPEADVRSLLLDGSLAGRKIGRQWVTSAAAVDELSDQLEYDDDDEEEEDACEDDDADDADFEDEESDD